MMEKGEHPGKTNKQTNKQTMGWRVFQRRRLCLGGGRRVTKPPVRSAAEMNKMEVYAGCQGTLGAWVSLTGVGGTVHALGKADLGA